MSDYYIANPIIGAPGPVTATHTAPQFPLGFEVIAVDRSSATSGGGGFGVFQYCRGSNCDSAGAFVHIRNGSAVLLAAANSALNFPIGVAAAVLSATSQYGWVQVQGRVDYARGTNVSNAVGVQRYICAGTPGIVVSDVVAGNRIQGVNVPADQSATAAVSASGIYELNRPFCAGLTASL